MKISYEIDARSVRFAEGAHERPTVRWTDEIALA
jgi:hypothetical protein